MDKVLITSGKYRGRKLTAPGGATHPMGSREKIALFNMLTGVIEGARVLDCFAGSGALGCEALSRGAKSVVFVEKSPKAAKVIRRNLDSLGIDDSEVIQGDISNVMESLGSFDVILADPPYDDFDPKKIESLVPLLGKNGVLALSHPGEAIGFVGLKLLKSHQYAGAHISLYTKD